MYAESATGRLFVSTRACGAYAESVMSLELLAFAFITEISTAVFNVQGAVLVSIQSKGSVALIVRVQ